MTRFHQAGEEVAASHLVTIHPPFLSPQKGSGVILSDSGEFRAALAQKNGNLVGQLMENGSSHVLKRHQPEGMLTTSSDSLPTKHHDIAMKRKQAAEWIESVTGLSIPASSDHDFRAALRDGAVLCKLLDTLKPQEAGTGADTKINIVNVNAFLTGLRSLGFPSDLTFSATDLESEGWEDRPRVVECILHLKHKLDTPKVISSVVPLQNHANLSVTADSSSSNTLSALSSNRTANGDQYLFASKQQNGGNPHLVSATTKGMHAAVGVTNLMRHCTQLLQEKMWSDGGKRQQQVATRPNMYMGGMESSPLEAMGPVLESVLHSLTQEYEKRLLAKDHELTAAKEKLGKVELRHDATVMEVAKLKAELSDKRASASAHAAAESRVLAERYKLEVQQLQEKLRQKESQLDMLRKERDLQSSKLLEELASMQAAFEQLKVVESKYKAVVEENRVLYNQVQDLRGTIRVFCRVRPLGKTGDTSASCLDVGTDGELALYDLQKSDRKIFKFDKVFDMDSTQDQVYDEVQGLVRSVLDGYNVCIFAYGQTGSGKTHTMSGTNVHTLEGRGMNYRALDDLFALQQNRSSEVEYNIVVQMLEIYNENLRDLLVDPSATNRPKNLDILNTQASGCNVPGAVQVEVHNAADVVNAMDRGASNRAVGETRLNERSSRSHQILSVIVDGHNLTTGARTHGCLHLVDLAGSERVAKSEATGDRLLEAQHINRSLSALGDVMSALASKNGHVPFRNSKLTQLLQDSLSGQAKVMMFMHIAPESSSFGESLSTLKFGTRVSEIMLGQAKKNVESGKVFAAHEQLQRAQRACEERTEQCKQLQSEMQSIQQQLKQLQNQVEHERNLRSAEAARVQRAEGQAAELMAELEALRKQNQQQQQQLQQQQLQQQQQQSQQQQQQQVPAPAPAAALSGGQPTSQLHSADSTCSTSHTTPVLAPGADVLEPTKLSLRPGIGSETSQSMESFLTPAVSRELESTSSVASHTTPRASADRSMSSYQRHLERMKHAIRREDKSAPAALPSTAPPSSRGNKCEQSSSSVARPRSRSNSLCSSLQLDICTPRSNSFSSAIPTGIKSATSLPAPKATLAGSGWR